MKKVHILCEKENPNIPEDLREQLGELEYRVGYVSLMHIALMYDHPDGTMLEMNNGERFIVKEKLSELI